MPTPTPNQEVPQTVYGSYYSLENNLHAKLLLNNKDPNPKEIRPTIYSLDGQTLELPPVTVEAASFRFIDLNDWALIGGANFRQGSVRLRYTGKDLAIGAQIYLTDETNSLSFEEKFAEEKMMDSLQLEGVWWQPTNQTNSRIVLSNTTNDNLTVTARLFKRPQHSGDLQTFQLLPHQTRVLRLREDFSDGNQFANSNAVGVSVSHNGAKTALMVRALVSDASKGYSMVVPFSNPNTARSRQLHGAGLHLDNVQGERLTPVLVLRNPSVTETYVTIRVPYTRENGTRGMVALSPRRLRSGEIDLVNLNNISQQAENEQIKTAGIEIEHNTNGAAIIAQVQSVSDNRNQVMRTLLWDAPAQKSATGGYPWLIDETSATRVFIKNITNEAQQYVSFIRWENGGMYMLGLKTLEPRETVAIEVKKLRDNQTPDEQGRVIPININRGQIEWTLRDRNGQFPSSPSARIRLVGQAEQVDTTKGLTSAYFCQQCCQGSFVDGYIFGPSDVDYGGATAQYEAWEWGENCYNIPYDFRVDNQDVDWESSHTNIATINQNGVLTTVAVGQTEISAEWGVTRHINYEYCGGGPLLWENTISEKFTVINQVQDSQREPKGPETDVPDCNSCTSVPATLDPEMTVHVNPRVRILQYQEPGTSNFVDITGTLYVLKDTTVTFKAAPDPPNSTFPANMPTWGGTGGATGTGATKQITFNTVSQNTSDYKTVIAGNPTAVTVNVIVYELTGTLTPQYNFTGRSQDNYGVAEKIDLNFASTPPLTSQQIGDLEWKRINGASIITNNTQFNGAGLLVAPDISSTEDLKLEIRTGPSKGNGVSYTKTVVSPNGAVAQLIPGTNILHTRGYCHVAINIEAYLRPTDVSFGNLLFYEGLAYAQASGYYAALDCPQPPLPPNPTCYIHPQGAATPITNCNITNGCLAFQDFASTGLDNPPCYNGDFVWNIPWKYTANTGVTSYLIRNAAHHQHTTYPDQTLIEKAGVGPFTKRVTDRTVNY